MDINKLIARAERPLIAIAHQDDELGYAGLIQRLGPKVKFIFMTNGDGLAPFVGDDPVEYAEMRKAEAVDAVGSLGIPAGNVACLDFSEIEIYSRMADLVLHKEKRAEVMDFFSTIRAAVAEAIRAHRPDVVFTTAFQGGHPEHDLAHFFYAMALDDLHREGGEKVPLIQLPEYELTILLPMRFRPWYPGERLALELTEEELEGKLNMTKHYPSQEGLFKKFMLVADVLSFPLRLVGRGGGARAFFSREVMSPVPDGFDYTSPPYFIDFFNYMFDDFEKTPISFRKCILPVVRHFLEASP